MRALVLVVLVGCSAATLPAHPTIPADGAVDCNLVPPVLDTIGAGMLVFADVGTALDGNHTESAKVWRVVTAPFLVAYLLSGTYGWWAHARCTRVRDLSDHDKALLLTRDALTYARGGRCHNALVLGHRIESNFGEDEYAHFLAEPAIQYCVSSCGTNPRLCR